MKYLKTYEFYIDKENAEENSDILKKYKHKIGDLVKYTSSGVFDLLEIVTINTTDKFQPYQVKDNFRRYWMSGNMLVKPTEDEIKEYLLRKNADKYNL